MLQQCGTGGNLCNYKSLVRPFARSANPYMIRCEFVSSFVSHSGEGSAANLVKTTNLESVTAGNVIVDAGN